MSVPQPPSTGQPLPQQQPTPVAVDDGAKKFGALPVWALVSSVLIMVGGVVAYVIAKTADVVAMCGSERMSPNHECERTRNGMTVGVDSYGEVLANARHANTAWQWIGIALVVIGVVFTALTILRWRQDAAMRSRLGNEHGAPLTSHSRSNSTSIILVLLGAGAIGFAVYLMLGSRSDDNTVGMVIAGIIALVGLAVLWAALPKNGALVQTFDDGVRVVGSGKVVDLPWQQVSYTIMPAKGAASHSLGGPGLKNVFLGNLSNHEMLQQTAQQRSVQAQYRPALEAFNRGETVSFGAFSISRDGLATGRKVLPWNEYGGIGLSQGTLTVSRLPKGKFASTGLGTVKNYTLFVHVLEAISKQQPRTGPAL